MFFVLELLLLLLKIGYFYLEALVRVFIPRPRKDITGQNVLITGITILIDVLCVSVSVSMCARAGYYFIACGW